MVLSQAVPSVVGLPLAVGKAASVVAGEMIVAEPAAALNVATVVLVVPLPPDALPTATLLEPPDVFDALPDDPPPPPQAASNAREETESAPSLKLENRMTCL
ncbi:hypothetical protein [Paraburkholderia acidisoli]|uniref:Uncharacterized protein n=1 Tax=Paraburkholderia acidisoli TaxID=2571748 RepID=A0A7Z2JJZ5_9BURK|nr:hypothetical protein [Paraburkholderia acidisoli]QGZ65900.1 hypothetical protein FAZ98_29140 [Paraburkholderia acidisoli]